MKLKKLKSSICGLFIIMQLALVNASCSNGSNEDIVSDYMVTVTAGERGTAISERISYVVGEEVNVTATAYNGYSFMGWYEDSNQLSTEISYTFNMPARNIQLQAVFESVSQPSEKGRYLVVYYTWSNNTKSVADELRSIIGGSMVEVTPSTPYTTDYNTMLNVGQQELNAIDNSGIYPAINTKLDSFSDYDVVFIGYPLWYSRMATPMQAFLHNHTSLLSGKKIALFCTSASSGISGTVTDARRLCPEADFLESLRIGSSSADNSHDTLVGWLGRIGVAVE